MLVRAPEKETGLSPEFATAATRWRPRSSSGWRGEGRRGPARGGVGPGGRCGAAWGGGLSRRCPAALLSGGQRRSAPARREAERERGGRRRLDWFANSEKFKGPTVKLK